MAHLLLIDDDSELLPAIVCHVFPTPGHRVEIAHTGRAGLDCIAAKPPDVVLLDLRLPDQSGLEVLEEIRAIDARIPVIFITLSRSADSAIEAMRHGAYDYLLKPLDLQKLEQVVGNALKVARLMRMPAIAAPTRRQALGPWTINSRARSSLDAARRCRKSARPSAASPTRLSPY